MWFDFRKGAVCSAASFARAQVTVEKMICAASANSRFEATRGIPVSNSFWRTFALCRSMSNAKIRVSPADFRPLAICEPASPKPTNPTLISVKFIDVAHTEFGKFGAKPVKIHTQFAGFQSFACLLLLREAFAGKTSDFSGCFAFHHNNAVGIGNDDIAGTHSSARTNDRHINRTGCRFNRSLSVNRFGPHWEIHFGQVSHIANAGIDDQSNDAVRTRGL